MLFITRRIGGKVVITVPPSDVARTITVEMVKQTSDGGRLAFDAPPEVVIDREEVHADKLSNYRFASATESAIRRQA